MYYGKTEIRYSNTVYIVVLVGLFISEICTTSCPKSSVIFGMLLCLTSMNSAAEEIKD